MDPHRQPGALDALIQDGLAMQGLGHDLDQLVHESVQDVLGGQLSDVNIPHLPGNVSFGLPSLDLHLHPSPRARGTADTDIQSHVRDATTNNNNSGGVGIAGSRPRRRAAAAANFTTDGEGSDEDSFADEDGGDNEGDVQETGSSGQPGRGSKRRRGASAAGNAASDAQKPSEQRKSYMKGRFSGRLPTKDDERKLADECQLMAPLLSDDAELCTLPTIIRAMATGSVRAHLERQRAMLEDANARLAAYEQGRSPFSLADHNIVGEPQSEVEIARLKLQVAALEQRLAEAGLSPRMDVGSALVNSVKSEAQAMQCVGTVAATMGQGLTMSIPPSALPVQAMAMSLPVQAAAPQQPQQQVILGSTPMVTQQLPGAEVPTTTILAPQMLSTTMPSQTMVVPAVPQASAVPSMLRSAPSTAQLVDTNGPPSIVMAGAPAQPDGEHAPVVTAAGVAASNLNEHAQQLAVTAKLHEAAKAEASVQAQQLAATAQQHAQASVQAAQQAEELKKTLAVLPHSQQAQAAVATVQDLEARAQAHASITTQVVAQARGMHEKAQAHEKEQYKAITQANMLQAHAHSLQASAQHFEAQVTQATVTAAVAAEPSMAMPPSLPTLQAIHSGGGGGVISGNTGGVPAVGGQDTTRLPPTPHSTSSGALFGSVSGHGATQGVQIVVQPQQHSTSMMQLSTLQTAEHGAAGGVMPPHLQQQPQPAGVITSTLVAQPSGDHASEVIVLQQQIAVLQAQQQAQAAAAQAAAAQAAAAQVAVAAAAQAQVVAVQAVSASHQPPVTVQILPAMHRATSHGVLLMPAGTSSSVGLEGGAGPPVLPVESAGANVPAESVMMPLQNGPQRTGLSPAPTEVERTADMATAHPPNAGAYDGFMESFLPSHHPLVMDPENGSAAAFMAPIVTIPETGGTAAAKRGADGANHVVVSG